MNLQMLDMILSYKKPVTLFDKIADSAIIKYQNKLYPGLDNKYNHIRVFIGNYRGISDETTLPLVFEWSSPVSKIVPLRPWMLDPSYAIVSRHSAIKLDEGTFKSTRITKAELYAKDYPEWRISPNGKIYSTPLLEYSLERAGKLYDYLQLLGIGLGLKWLQLGKNHEVCSTGARELFEDITGIRIFGDLPIWKTPPSAFINDPEWHRVV